MNHWPKFNILFPASEKHTILSATWFNRLSENTLYMYTSTDEAGLIIPFGVCGARRAALLHRKDPLKHKSVTVLTSRKYSHHNGGTKWCICTLSTHFRYLWLTENSDIRSCLQNKVTTKPLDEYIHHRFTVLEIKNFTSYLWPSMTRAHCNITDCCIFQE